MDGWMVYTLTQYFFNWMITQKPDCPVETWQP